MNAMATADTLPSKRRKLHAHGKQVHVSASLLSGTKVFHATLHADTRISQLLRQMYTTCIMDRPSTIALSYAGQTLCPINTLNEFRKDEVDLSCVYISSLKSMAGLQCLDRAPSVARVQVAKQWASVYNRIVHLDELTAGDALAYVLAYEKPSDLFSEATNHVIETKPMPMMMMLQFEEHRDHEGVKLSAFWSNYSLYSNEAWHKVWPAQSLHTWDEDMEWESKEDIIEAVFEYLHLEDDPTYVCYLVWPEQLDGVRLNFKAQEGFKSPLQPKSLGIKIELIPL